MLVYILKLLLLIPLIGALAWGSLALAKRVKTRIETSNGPRLASIVETTMLSPSTRLVVIDFHGAHILVAASRTGFTRLAECASPAVGPANKGAAE